MPTHISGHDQNQDLQPQVEQQQKEPEAKTKAEQAAGSTVLDRLSKEGEKKPEEKAKGEEEKKPEEKAKDGEEKKPEEKKDPRAYLKQKGPMTPEQEKELKAFEKMTYEDSLGKLLGGKLYDALGKAISTDKILGYADQAVDGLFKAATSGAGKASFLDTDGKAAASALVDILGDILKEKADSYLGSDEGKKLAQKISAYPGLHPWQVVTTAILAGVGAVAYAWGSNMSIPEIKQKLHLAEGLDAEIHAKLGKVQKIAAEAIGLRIKYQRGWFKGELGAEYKQDGKDNKIKGSGSITLGDDKAYINAMGEMDEAGDLKFNLGGHKQFGDKLGVDVKGTEDTKTDAITTDATVTYGDDAKKWTGGLKYDVKTGDVGLSLGNDVKDGLFSHHAGMTLDSKGQFGMEQKDRYGTDKDYFESKMSSVGGADAFSLTGQRTLGNTTLRGSVGEDKDGPNAELYGKYSHKDLTAELDAKFAKGKSSLSGSFEGKPSANTTLKGDASYSLSDAKFLSYGVSFGFKDPKEFESFLIAYKHSTADNVPIDEFKAQVEFTVGKLMARVTTENKWKDGGFSSGSVEGLAAYPINDKFSVIGGMAGGYGPNADIGMRPELGMQIKHGTKKVAIVGYADIKQDKGTGWGLKLVIPF